MKYLFTVIFIVLLHSCIGTDIIEDFIEPRIALLNKIEGMIVGDNYQFEAVFFDNVGAEVPTSFVWDTSNSEVLEIDGNGVAIGTAVGMTTVTYSANGLSSSFNVSVFDPDEVNADSIRMSQESQTERTATLKTVSSYQLDGTATLELGSRLQIILSSDFKTTNALPGLYLYLTNNPNTINNALEIGAVREFTGAQVYDVPGNVGLQDFSHILFYCKPFVVPVGVGKFEP